MNRVLIVGLYQLMYLKMAAFRNNDADKISKSVVNIIDTTMTVFYVRTCAKTTYFTIVVAKFSTVLSISVSVSTI